MEVLLKTANLPFGLALWRACMANSAFGVTEEQIASQTGSFHFLLAPFVVDVICMLRFHIVRLVEILMVSYSSWCFLIEGR